MYVRMSVFLVVLAGGNGTRLWPLSRASKPKQFLSFCHEGTMLQKVIKRNQITKTQKTIVLTGIDHIALVEEQLEEINISNTSIIVEPEVKNTAPAIIAAGLRIYEENPDAIMIVTPSDNDIRQLDKYKQSITTAIDFAQQGYYVTLAIKPLRPEVAYGYMKQGTIISGKVFLVDKFFEKPNLEKAKEYINSGNYFWNSGIFIFPVKRFLDEISLLEPTMLQYIQDAFDRADIQQNKIFLDNDTYGQIHANSIDYALMEKTHKVVAVQTEFPWNDMGTLRSIWETQPKDSNGNVLSTNAITINTKNIYINSTSHRVIAAVDVDNISIIETSDVLLIANSNSSHSIKCMVDEISRTDIKDDMVIKPWGMCETLTRGEKFFIKKIKVKPSKSLTLKPDHDRGQHWIVISGLAQVNNRDTVTVFKKNNYLFISPQEAYIIANISLEDLELIEVCSDNTNMAAAKATDFANTNEEENIKVA